MAGIIFFRKVEALSEAESDVMLRQLHANERQRIMRYSHAHRRAIALQCRWWLKQYLSTYVNIPREVLQLDVAENGKPSLSAIHRLPSPVHFNMSHSGDQFVIAISTEGEVGVDLEYVNRRRDVVSIAQTYFTTAEYQWLKSLSNEKQNRAFYLLWVLKEAYVKANGKGIANMLANVDCSALARRNLLNDDKKLAYVGDINDGQCAWQCCATTLAVDVHVAVCCKTTQKLPLEWQLNVDNTSVRGLLSR